MRSGKLEKEILILFAILFVGYGFYKSMSGCMVEAIIHYNQGAKSYGLPPKNDLMRIATIVLLFSFINTSIIKQ